MCLEGCCGLLVSVGGEGIEDDRCAGGDLGDQHVLNVCSKSDSIYYRQCIFAENGTRGIAPLMTQGAISASWVSPAIRVCVLQLPKGASMVTRAP